MIISVTAHPNAKNPRVEQSEDGTLRVYVNERAQDGKANEAIIKTLAHHLNVKRSQIFLIKGAKSKKKVFEVME